tara:strand:- start:1258 stop:1839 length:582 start_codon:yes stop_codon:yes gene_type:complete
MSAKKSVWATLSAVDCADKIEKKGKLNFLSWAWAWGILMQYYEDSTFEFSEPNVLDNGTVEVQIALTIDGVTRTMWLPVMDIKNNSIKNPSSREISDARMRCLVKAIALFGLGHYIYAGEDLLPASDNIQAANEPQNLINKKQISELKAALKDSQKSEEWFLQNSFKGQFASLSELSTDQFNNVMLRLAKAAA